MGVLHKCFLMNRGNDQLEFLSFLTIKHAVKQESIFQVSVSGVIWYFAFQIKSWSSWSLLCDIAIWVTSTGMLTNGAVVLEAFTMNIVSGKTLWLWVLDNMSSTTVHCPFLYLSVKWNPCNRIVQRIRQEDGFGCWTAHVRAAWSVNTLKGRPSRYGRHFSTAQTKAKHSFSDTVYAFSSHHFSLTWSALV